MSKAKNDSSYLIESDLEWVNEGFDMFSRRFSLTTEEIEYEHIHRICRGICECYRIDPNKEILLEISCGGGPLYETLGIFYKLKKLPGLKLRVEAIGSVQSSALLLFLCGTTRVCTRATRFMMHKCSDHDVPKIGKEDELGAISKELKVLDSEMLKILAENTNKDRKWWKRKIKRGDFYFDAKIAKEIGVIND